MAPVLGYWDIRGLAEPIRYLLNYLGVEFEDKRYQFGTAPNYFDSIWTKEDKFNLGLELPNIPYYIDGDIKITQSLAIMKYLSRKHDALYNPETENDLIRFQMMEGHAKDISTGISFMANNPLFEKIKETFGDRFKDHIKTTSKFLGSNDWIMGNKISFVDFLLYEALDVIQMAYPNSLNDYDNLVSFQERFRALPGVRKYMENTEKRPLYSPYASWGGSLENSQKVL